MQWKRMLPLTCLLALLCAPAVADEIVYFTNGTSMTVAGHEIDEGVIRLDLGDQAFVAFPIEQIDKIETTDGITHNANEIRANRIAPGSGSSAHVPARHRRQWQGHASSQRRLGAESGVERDRNGVAVYYPYANSPSLGKRQFSVLASPNRNPTGSAAGGGIVGTVPVGTRSALPSPGSKHRRPIGIQIDRDKAFTAKRSDDSEKDEKK